MSKRLVVALVALLALVVNVTMAFADAQVEPVEPTEPLPTPVENFQLDFCVVKAGSWVELDVDLQGAEEALFESFFLITFTQEIPALEQVFTGSVVDASGQKTEITLIRLADKTPQFVQDNFFCEVTAR